MTRWHRLLTKLGLTAFAIYASSRVLGKLAKLMALTGGVAALVFHRQLVLLALGADALTGAIASTFYGAAPQLPPASAARVQVGVDSDAAATELSGPLLGFAIDTSQVVGGRWWSKDAVVEVGRGAKATTAFDFTRPRLQKLARALSPALLRIGGTEADHVFYSDKPRAGQDLPPGYEYSFTQTHWNQVAGFVDSVGFELLFTVNAGPGPRDEEGAWQPDNAERLLRFARERSAGDVVWELGNEINGYWLIHGINERVSGEQYAEDFSRFRGLVAERFPGARVAGPAGFLWPVIGEPFESTLGVFEDYLKAGGAEANIVTWHYYPQQSRRCPIATRRATPQTLLHPGFLDETGQFADALQAQVAMYAPKATLWLGETGNAQCGGEPGVSDTFASSLWYLDQLGLMGQRGQPMIRQTLVGSHYGLLDSETLAPRPDYWAAWLVRQLVSERMLSVKRNGENQYVRSYASCTPSSASDEPGDATFWFINLHPSQTARLELSGRVKQRYLATAPELTSSDVLLNGQRLTLTGEQLPSFLALTNAASRGSTSLGSELSLPPHSYALVVVGSQVQACR